jgi:hypothetical protein
MFNHILHVVQLLVLVLSAASTHSADADDQLMVKNKMKKRTQSNKK